MLPAELRAVGPDTVDADPSGKFPGGQGTLVAGEQEKAGR